MGTSSDMRSKLAKVKGLGSAHHGVGHWWQQRVTALVLVALAPWFLYSLITAMLAPDVVQVATWFSSPFNAVMLVLMLVAIFWHAKLGTQVVIEDYVHGHGAKYFLLLSNTFFCTLCAAISILAVLRLHFLDVFAAAM